jgi:hypothetical protein
MSACGTKRTCRMDSASRFKRGNSRGRIASSPFDLTLFVKRLIYGQISGEEHETYG